MLRYALVSMLFVLFLMTTFVTNTLTLDKSSLVAYWSFDKDSGGTVTDESGNEFNGKVMGGEWIKNGKIGGAMDFDGADAYVDVASDPGLDPGEDDWTVEAWIKRAESDPDWHKILTKYPCCDYQGYRLGLREDSVHVIFGMGAPPSCAELQSETKILDREWHHVAFTADRNEDVIIYIDGVPDKNTEAIKQIKGVSIATPQNLEIGRCHWCGGTLGFLGTIDEVRIWRSALTETEIQQAMIGKLMPVLAKGGLPTCWGNIKSKMQ